jgi:hypothetical protein
VRLRLPTPDSRLTGVIGLGFLYASGVVYLVELALAIVGVRWNVWNVTLPAVVIAIVSVWRGLSSPRSGAQARKPAPHVVDLLTLVTVAAYALYATVARVWEWDFWAIWGLKARVFFEAHTIDWRFLESRWNDFAHPDYPLLLPLNYDYAALLAGGWSDRWLGVFNVAFGIALLLIVREILARETTPLIASAITFAATGFALSGFIGLAEAPLIAFAAAAILFLRRAVLYDDRAAMWHGAILAGFAACTKNEGTALLLTLLVALALSKPRLAWRLWPALAITVPWLAMRALHRLPTDLAQGSFVTRVLHRLPHLGAVAMLLIRNLHTPWLWAVILVALLVVPHALRVRERFVLLVFAIQVAIYVITYLGTPWSIEWQVATSWPRLSSQVATPLLVVVMLMLARTFAREDDLAHAEARSDI